MFVIDDILDIAIQIEQNAEKIYRNAQKKISNPSLASMLNWLADEEVDHANWFSDLKKRKKRTTFSGCKPIWIMVSQKRPLCPKTNSLGDNI
jgi:rubrerythrin